MEREWVALSPTAAGAAATGNGYSKMAFTAACMAEFLRDKCRHGADYHVWSLYFCECIGDACLSYEADIMGWHKKDEIISLPELTRPTGYFLSKYFGVQLSNIREDN